MLKIGMFLGICYSAAFGMSSGAAAQAMTVKSTHGEWRIQCQHLGNATVDASDLTKEMVSKTDADKSKQRCQMMQQVRSSENKNVGLMVAFLKVPKNKKDEKSLGVVLQILAPLGIFLPTGLALEIDGTAKGRIQFSNCLQGGCLAQSPMTAELLKALKLGGTANFIVYQAPGRGLPMPISLKGFTAAYKALLDS